MKTKFESLCCKIAVCMPSSIFQPEFFTISYCAWLWNWLITQCLFYFHFSVKQTKDKWEFLEGRSNELTFIICRGNVHTSILSRRGPGTKGFPSGHCELMADIIITRGLVGVHRRFAPLGLMVWGLGWVIWRWSYWGQEHRQIHEPVEHAVHHHAEEHLNTRNNRSGKYVAHHRKS